MGLEFLAPIDFGATFLGRLIRNKEARERIQARLKQLEAEEPPIEFLFTLADQWSRHLFVALMRRCGIRPYRYRGQRRTTVMAHPPEPQLRERHPLAGIPGAAARCQLRRRGGLWLAGN